VIGDRSLGSEPADEVMNGVDGDADGSADVDDLEVAGADELVHRASGDPECPSGIFDGQEQHEAAWAWSAVVMAGDAVEILWLLERLDHADVVERAQREKVLSPDFRHAMVDGRLAMARLCGLTGRHDEALSWFADARRVLTEQGARPLLAIADYDEALMYFRRGEPGDVDRARPSLDAGWIRRADDQTRQLD
jgi:hypothetical protein